MPHLRKDNATIEQLKEQLKDYKPGTPDFKRREEEITHRMSDLKVRASIEQRDFQERQMKAMYMIYREITEEVQRYAQANGLSLVMDYSSEPVDLERRADDSEGRQQTVCLSRWSGHHGRRAERAQSEDGQ